MAMETQTITSHSFIIPHHFTIPSLDISKPRDSMKMPALFTQERLRVGYPDLCPAPCRAVRLEDGFEAHVDFNSVLDLKVVSITTVGRIHLLDTDQKIRPTLLITVRNSDPEAERWGQQAKKIYEEVLGFPGLMVEIASENFDRIPFHFSPFEHDPISVKWESVIQQVFNTLNLRGVYMLACFRIGYSDNIKECPPTISISVDHTCHRNWNEFYDQVKQLLYSFQLSETEVLITKEQDPRHMNTLASGSKLEANSQGSRLNIVAPGKEIARAGFLGRGTVGGCVQLLMPDQKDWITYIITAAHVGSSSYPNRADPDIQHTDTSGDSPILMESPPTEVLRLEKAKRIRQIASFEREIKDSDDETALLAREMLPLSKQSLEHITRQLEDKLNSVGTVKFQSDMIAVPCPPNSLRMMDWALISPNPAFSYSNNIIAGGALEDLASLQKFVFRVPKEIDLFMLGAQSKITPVYYNQCRVALVHSEIIDSKEHFVPTLEHCLGPRSPAAYASKHGDSGALIVTEQGWVVGMVIGGQETGPIAYFTASKDLREHILETTGAVDFRLLPTK